MGAGRELKDRLYITEQQFPFLKGFDVILDWKTQQDVLGGVTHPSGGAVVVHPFSFCRMFSDVYGGIAGLDMLKIMMHDHIDNLWRNNAKYYSKERIEQERYSPSKKPSFMTNLDPQDRGL